MNGYSRILFICSLISALSLCKTISVEKKEMVEVRPEGQKISESKQVSQYSKKEKVEKFEIMLAELVKKIRKVKNLSPLLEVSDEYSNFGTDEYEAKVLNVDFVKLESVISYLEFLHILKFGRKGIVGDGGSVEFSLVKDNFEYGLDFTFNRKPGRWIFVHLSKLRPERSGSFWFKEDEPPASDRNVVKLFGLEKVNIMKAEQNNLTGVESATRRSFSFMGCVEEKDQSDRDAAERKILAFAMKAGRAEPPRER